MESEHTPLGSPEPVEDATSWLALFGAIGTTILAVGGSIVLISSTAMRSRGGASRGARLEWAERQTEIERAVMPPDPQEDQS